MSELLNDITEKALSDYDRLRDDAGLVDLGVWSLLQLKGEDRKGWLQGQVTADLRHFNPGASTSFCVCSPTGQIECVADAWALGDSFAITLEKEAVGAFMNRVDQMVVLEDVVAEDLSQNYRLLSVQGPSATNKLAEIVELPKLDAGEAHIGDAPVYVFRSNRTGLGGWDVWLPSSRRKAAELLRTSFATVAVEAYEAARIEAGSPSYGSDYTVKTLASELGPAFEAKHISYTKGCYTGQEVLMRIHSRGHTNRMWVGLLADSSLEVGSPVAHRMRSDAGHVTSSAFSPDFGHVGAALVRNEFAQDREIVKVKTSAGEIEAEVRRMPILRLS